MLKRSVYLGLLMVMVVLCVGCGSGSNGGDGTGVIPNPNPPTATPTTAPALLATIEGTVYEADGFTLLPSVYMVIDTTMTASAQGNYHAVTTAGTDAKYRFENVPYGSYQICFYRSAQDYLTDPNSFAGKKVVDIVQPNHTINLVAGVVDNTPTPTFTPTPIPGNPTPSPTPTVVIPSGQSAVNISLPTVWGVKNVKLIPKPIVDAFGYVELISGTYKVWGPSVFTTTYTGTDGKSTVNNLNPGTYQVFILESNNYIFLGNFNALPDQLAAFNFTTTGKKLLNLTMRFEKYTTFEDKTKRPKVLAKFVNSTTLQTTEVFLFNIDNYDDKEEKISVYLDDGTYTEEFVAMDPWGGKYSFDKTYDLNSLDQKILISGFNPTGTPTVEGVNSTMIRHNDSSLVGLFWMILSELGRATGISESFDLSATVDDMPYTIFTGNRYYCSNVQMNYSGTKDSGKKGIVEIRSNTGWWSFRDLLGSDFVSDQRVFQILFCGQTNIGIRILGQENVTNIGAGEIQFFEAGNLQTEEVADWP